MGLTATQKLKETPKETQSWTKRNLFPLAAISSAIIKKTDILELFGGFMLIVAGIGELSGRSLSIFFYIILFAILGGIGFFKYQNAKKEL